MTDDARTTHFIARSNGARLALFRQEPRQPNGRAVLIVHGATFPTSLSGAYRIAGRSWFDEVCATGFDTWGLDFQGFGDSDGYPESSERSPPGRAEDAAAQVETAIEFIRSESRTRSLALIAHSWGTVPAGVLLSQRPGIADSVVFYGPVVASDRAEPASPTPKPPFIDVNRQAQWDAFGAGVPHGIEPPIGEDEFAVWSDEYLRGRAHVTVPSGPMVDIERARRGTLPYDPANIEIPALVVRGTWDAVTSEADSIRFFHALRRSPSKQLLWIHGGTHRMHLERRRFELFGAVSAFLHGVNSA